MPAIRPERNTMPQPQTREPASLAELLESPEFHAITARKNKVSLMLTLAILAVYFGFIFLIAFRKDLVGANLTANVTWGIPMGLGVIAAAWVLTGIYVVWANSRYDVMVENLRKKWGK
ncbi:MAG: hypothetical protein JWO30_4775 [Fibrobacteres bacterium]|nr:hypothetical protein [Fibrobacterota bacterium]